MYGSFAIALTAALAPQQPRAQNPINVSANILLLSGDANASRQLAKLLARDMKVEIDAITPRSA